MNNSQLVEASTGALSSSVAVILKQLMIRAGNISQAELARQTDIPPPTLHKLLTGQTTDPRMTTLMTLADFFNVGMDEITGMLPLTLHSHDKLPAVSVPVVSWEEITGGGAFLAGLTASNWNEWVTIESNAGDFFALKSKASMAPIFLRGSLLVVKRTQIARDGDYVVVHYKGTSSATLREILIDGPTEQLISLGTGSIEVLNRETVTVLGVVTQSRYLFE